jgi:D-aminoacyl-tRNA deacylase
MLVQRVTHASVVVDNQCVGSIQRGLLVLVGVGQGDTKEVADKMVEKMIALRIFSDDQGKMNLSVADVHGELLLVSQFTLYADCTRGRRPAFTQAAQPEVARSLYQHVIELCRSTNLNVQCGVFAADMKVSLVNDGPVTLMLDSASS